jgi:hypothetical protein
MAQVATVWFDTEGDPICINTAEGRTKWRNMKRRPRVAMVIVDPDDPYRAIQVPGVVTGWMTDGARGHSGRLAKKCRGVESHSVPPRQPRGTSTIRAEAVSD